jgi:MarR family transcriptional regulator, organic hydroperoxide resistance regulator
MTDEPQEDPPSAFDVPGSAGLAAIYRPGDAAPVDQIPLEISLGYQVRSTHRALQRYLRAKIEPHGVTLGMWYFLRVLWQQDGLTQRELSRRIGTMEPTTLNAIAAMERAGLVHRVRDERDRRRQFVFLTEKGRAARRDLLPLAGEVVRDASRGLTLRELSILLSLLAAIQANLADPAGAGSDGDDAEA